MSTPGQGAVTKGIAVSLIALGTGRGRRIIEGVLDKLAAEGKIAITQDTIDKRSLMISRADIDVVIKYINERGTN